MSSCSVFGCRNNRKNSSDKVQFHHFPKNPVMAKMWITACRRKNPFNIKNARVCSAHFPESARFESMQQRLLNYTPRNQRKLKEDAVPTEHLPEQETLSGEAVHKDRRRKQGRRGSGEGDNTDDSPPDTVTVGNMRLPLQAAAATVALTTTTTAPSTASFIFKKPRILRHTSKPASPRASTANPVVSCVTSDSITAQVNPAPDDTSANKKQPTPDASTPSPRNPRIHPPHGRPMKAVSPVVLPRIPYGQPVLKEFHIVPLRDVPPLPVRTEEDDAEAALQSLERRHRQVEERYNYLQRAYRALEVRNAKLERESNTQAVQRRLNKVLAPIFSPRQIEYLMSGDKKNVNWTVEDLTRAVVMRQTVGARVYRYLRRDCHYPLPRLAIIRQYAEVAPDSGDMEVFQLDSGAAEFIGVQEEHVQEHEQEQAPENVEELARIDAAGEEGFIGVDQADSCPATDG